MYENEYGSLCILFTKFLVESESELFYKHEH